MPLYKVPFQLSCRPPSGTRRLLEGLPGAFPAPSRTAPTVVAFSHRTGIPALWSVLWPSSGPTPTAPCLSCAEGSRAGCLTPGEVTPEQSRGAESPLLTCWSCFFWCSPGYSWPSWLWAHTARSRWASHQPAPPSSSPRGCSQSILRPACTCAWEFPDPCAGSCIWPSWTSWGSHMPTSQACQHPSGQHPLPSTCQLHYMAWSHRQTCWECTQSHCPCHLQRC